MVRVRSYYRQLMCIHVTTYSDSHHCHHGHCLRKNDKMSLCMRKQTIWVPARSDTNRPVHSQKQAKQVKKKTNWTTRVAKTKALISFAATAKLVCAFVFAYANCWFSHAAAQMIFFIQFNVTVPFQDTFSSYETGKADGRTSRITTWHICKQNLACLT